jgi:hypothetical protein
MRRILLVAATVLLAGCSLKFGQSNVLLDVDAASRMNPTDKFTVTGTWDLKYSWDCSKQISQGVGDTSHFGMIIFNADDDTTAFENPETDRTGRSGHDTYHFKQPGAYYVKVNSSCDWRVQVTDTSQG